MSLIFANWFKPQSEEATEGEGGATSSSTRAEASGASSSSSVHVDGWRLPRPSEGVRSRRASRDLHAWPAPTPTPHTPSLLHRSGGLPRLLTTVCLHPPTLERLSLRARANGRACRSLAPTLSLQPACHVQIITCLVKTPAPAPALAPALSFSRPPGGDAALLALHPAADGRLDTEPLRDVRLATALLDPRARFARDAHGSPVTRAAARAGLSTRHPPPRCNHATLQPCHAATACTRERERERESLPAPASRGGRHPAHAATVCIRACNRV